MNHPQYEILKNGERFAYTREPFGEDDDLHCETIIRWLESGKLRVGNKVAQILNPSSGYMDTLDAIEFVEEVEQIELMLAHPSVVVTPPSEDEWSFKEMIAQPQKQSDLS